MLKTHGTDFCAISGHPGALDITSTETEPRQPLWQNCSTHCKFDPAWRQLSYHTWCKPEPHRHHKHKTLNTQGSLCSIYLWLGNVETPHRNPSLGHYPLCPSATEMTKPMFSSLTVWKPDTGRAGVNYVPSYNGFKHFWELLDGFKVTSLLMHRNTFWHRRNSTGARYITP